MEGHAQSADRIDVSSLSYILSMAGLRGWQRVQLPRALCSKGAPRDDVCLFQMKYSLKIL